jgi:pSer/pThr/pTyr-binding forkhead associated (FHA) protein/Mg-chelatase subunit ChlD
MGNRRHMIKRSALFFSVVLFFLVQIQSGICMAKEKTTRKDAQKIQQRDIILVIDNSGSMLKNDPQFLTRNVVTEFLSGYRGKGRIGMVIFDQEARMVQPLLEMKGLKTRARFMESLKMVNYKGLFSDTPAAVERAIYELKINGRTDAQKIIILLTDGLVDTGDRLRDIEREKWLKESLTGLSKTTGIRIFGIAFTDQADFRLIQTLAFQTDGEYFRAQTVDDIEIIFDKINTLTSRPVLKPVEAAPQTVSEPPREPEIKPIAEAPKAEEPAVPASLIEKPEVASSPKPVQKQKPFLSTPVILVGFLVILLAVIAVVILSRISRSPAKTGAAAHIPVLRAWKAVSIPRAELVDVKNITERKTLTLEKSVTKVGRNSNNEIPIPVETVSSFHATIEYKDGFFYLEDQRSTNKTFLNDLAIKPSVPVKLKSGDEVRFHKYKFIFILPDLIPAGETVMDFRGKAKAPAPDVTVAHTGDPSREEADSWPQAMLIDAKNITTKKTFSLSQKLIKIGREADNDVIIAEETISSFHATIENRNDSFYLEDQRSKNKTFLNGEEIKPYSPTKLKSGDEIMINIYKFIFLLERQFPTGDTGESI